MKFLLKYINGEKNRTIFLKTTILYYIILLIISTLTITKKIELFPDYTNSAVFYQLPYSWLTFSWIGSWFSHLFAFLIIYVTPDKSSIQETKKTGEKNVSFFKNHFHLILFSALFFTVLIFLISLASGILNTDSSEINKIQYINYSLGIFIQMIAYMSLASVLSVFSNSRSMSYVLYFGYLIIESVFRKLLIYWGAGSEIYFLPAKSFSMLTANPVQIIKGEKFFPFYVTVLISLIWISIFWFIFYKKAQKKRQ